MTVMDAGAGDAVMQVIATTLLAPPRIGLTATTAVLVCTLVTLLFRPPPVFADPTAATTLLLPAAARACLRHLAEGRDRPLDVP